MSFIRRLRRTRPSVFVTDVHAPRAICTIFRGIPYRTKILRAHGIPVIAKFANRSSCGRGKHRVQTMIHWSGGRRLCVIALMAVCAARGRNRDPFFRCDALGFAEKRNEDDQCKNSALQDDGNCQRAAPDVALSRALFRVAFEETSTQRAEAFFGDCFRNFWGLAPHHTPRENFPRAEQEILRRQSPGGCSSSPGDQRRARRDVRLRASSLRWTPGLRTSSLGSQEEPSLRASGIDFWLDSDLQVSYKEQVADTVSAFPPGAS